MAGPASLRRLRRRRAAPRVVANEDVTAVVDREGRVHVWGPVVDAQGHERDDVTPDVTPDVTRAPNADAAKGTKKNEKVFVRASRCVAIAAGHACSFGAGGHRGGLRAFRNVAGIETNAMSGSGNPASRPPEFASPAAGVGVESARLFFRPRIVSVAAGRMHALAAAADGSLWSWGNDAAGQLGLGSTRGASALVQHFAGSLERLSSSPVAGSSPADASRPRRRGRVAARGVAVFGDGDASSRADAAKFSPAVSAVSAVRARSRHALAGSRRSRTTALAPPGSTPRCDASALLGVSVGSGGEAPRRLRGGVAPRSACVAAAGALFCWEQQARRARPGGRPGQGRAHARAGVRVWIRRRRRERFFGRGRKRRRRRRLRRLGRRRVRRRFLFVARASGGRFRASVPGRAERHGLRLGRGPRARRTFPFPAAGKGKRPSVCPRALGLGDERRRPAERPGTKKKKKKTRRRRDCVLVRRAAPRGGHRAASCSAGETTGRGGVGARAERAAPTRCCGRRAPSSRRARATKTRTAATTRRTRRTTDASTTNISTKTNVS